tara:strand:- start:29 stop:313 length:285 start_codon:yes stop_codon:yes gene_type:complete
VAKTTKTKIISLSLIISGILVLIAGISMVQTGFTSFDDTEPRVGLYIGGIFTIIGGVILTIAGIMIFFDFKKKLIRMFGNVANAIEEERKQEKR